MNLHMSMHSFHEASSILLRTISCADVFRAHTHASQDDAQEKQKRITLLQEQIEEANLQTMEAMEQKHESQAKANKYLGENNLLKDEKTKLEEEIDRLNSLPPPDESAKVRVATQNLQRLELTHKLAS